MTCLRVCGYRSVNAMSLPKLISLPSPSAASFKANNVELFHFIHRVDFLHNRPFSAAIVVEAQHKHKAVLG